MRLPDDVHLLLQEALLPSILDSENHHSFRVSQLIAVQSHVLRNTVAVLRTNGLKRSSQRDDFRQQIKYIKLFFGHFQFDDFVMVYHK